MSRIFRRTEFTTVTIESGTATSDVIDFTMWSMMQVQLPATWTSASIGFSVSTASAGTFGVLYDDDGTLVQIDSPTANKVYTAPADIAASGYLKLWSQDGSASPTDQGGDRVLRLTVKA